MEAGRIGIGLWKTPPGEVATLAHHLPCGSEPNSAQDLRRASRASEGVSAHHSRKVWLLQPNTRCGRRPPLWQAIRLPSNLRPETNCGAEYVARDASDPHRVAVKTWPTFPSPRW